MFCENCGKELGEDTKFCTFCGTRQSATVIAASRSVQTAETFVSAESESIPASAPETAPESFTENAAAEAPQGIPAGAPQSVPLSAPQAAPISHAVPTPNTIPVSGAPAYSATVVIKNEEKKPRERRYTLGHLILCLSAAGVMAVVAGVFAGLYFSVV